MLQGHSWLVMEPARCLRLLHKHPAGLRGTFPTLLGAPASKRAREGEAGLVSAPPAQEGAIGHWPACVNEKVQRVRGTALAAACGTGRHGPGV